MHDKYTREDTVRFPGDPSTLAGLLSRIQSYFGNGGLFNPEYMEHDKVRDLFLDILKYLRCENKLMKLVKLDKEAGAAYITLLPREIVKGEVKLTLHADDSDVLLDYDEKGRLIGIEILDLNILHPDVAEGGVVETQAR